MAVSKVRHKKGLQHGRGGTEGVQADHFFLAGGMTSPKKASAKTNKKTGKKLKKTGSKRTMPSKYNRPRGHKTKRR